VIDVPPDGVARVPVALPMIGDAICPKGVVGVNASDVKIVPGTARIPSIYPVGVAQATIIPARIAMRLYARTLFGHELNDVRLRYDL
jgi:hypothetical protein